ncbi:hypothetical protein DPSP01_006846 [Paraphaeosphaeria sporulosa]|uniref:RING-type domain-containing protein n=1 Tax=Paraphaeosphaeria sporulosa TaxID=1460663 RepID=A0A177CNR7_9PLEO|nr:uncharacterized protein CC84DRAFT_1162395 [Paraphaeosphaeria sporulosa]OAG08449.1 hypothetical protein CC84DRAFT_1162395 [Paraphaeosphaeria sporulosa]
MVQRSTSRFACALFATVAAATTIAPANSSTAYNNYTGTINLQDNQGRNITTLVPLTSGADDVDLNAVLFYTTTETANNISRNQIAYVSCDLSDYPGNIHVDSILSELSHIASGAILYSTTEDYCNYTSDNANMDLFALYSTTNKGDAISQKDTLEALQPGQMFNAKITRANTQNNSTDPTQNPGQTNPLGPSPSTAVAMIILYSITGVITALFLVIIVTGAVRAHRHPDRYGPRDVMGRPRQSRARGLGMAILDTIPIVKFGEREQPKPTDVELGSTSEARGVDGTADATATTTPPADTAPATETGTGSHTPPTAADHAEHLDSGIAPAAGAASAAGANGAASAEEGLGCSICTDDFEKGQDIRVLPCDHKFHPECVDPWLLNVSGTCPLCRVDLRPTTSHTSNDAEADPNSTTLAPPLQSEEPANRRHSTLRDILSFRSRPNASADERISALRRLREQRRNGSGEVAGVGANVSSEDVGAQDRRRSKRMSLFGRRRGDSVREEPPFAGEPSSGAASASAAPQPARNDESTALVREGDDTTAGAVAPNSSVNTRN